MMEQLSEAWKWLLSPDNRGAVGALTGTASLILIVIGWFAVPLIGRLFQSAPPPPTNHYHFHCQQWGSE